MASSPAEAGTSSPRAFALQELAACWNQGYEALARGNLEHVDQLLSLAQEHLASAGNGTDDSAADAQLRREAVAAHGRLQHGMQAGLTELQQEIARARTGGKALRGYGHASLRVGEQVTKDA
jgi:hypothetical protein